LTIGVLLSVLCVWVMDSHAQAKDGSACSPCYQVGGEIILKEIKKQGDLHVMLVTEESFNKPLQGFRKIIIDIGEKEIREKKVSFKFTQIPRGTYGIRCFLDQDKNGKLNRGAFGPSEPWCMSWQGKKPLGWPKFKYIAFDVERDVTDTRIVVE
jgi:uncharacterized protein (DUF2141 family)